MIPEKMWNYATTGFLYDSDFASKVAVFKKNAAAQDCTFSAVGFTSTP